VCVFDGCGGHDHRAHHHRIGRSGFVSATFPSLAWERRCERVWYSSGARFAAGRVARFGRPADRQGQRQRGLLPVRQEGS
jgi:hypothetical protein